MERLTGADLVGRSYTPPFSYYQGQPRAHRVVVADFVTTDEGTGLVTAPAPSARRTRRSPTARASRP